jgi:DNA gyrase inhibitor GyrI
MQFVDREEASRMVARSRLIGLVVGSTLVWCSAGCSGPNPPPKPPPPVAATGVKKPERKSVPPPKEIKRGPYGVEFFNGVQLVLAYQDVEGIPYVRTRDEIVRIRRLLREQGIVPIGFPFAIYLDDPRTVDPTSYRYRVASPVPPTAFPRKPLHRGILEAQRFARVVYEGDYDESYQVRHFEEIPRALEKMDYTVHGPILEVYRYSAAERNPENWVTEVWYPVKKKRKKGAEGPTGRGVKGARERPGKTTDE